MYAAIRQYEVDPSSVDEAIRRVNEGLVPIIKDASGFQAYYVLDAGDGRIASLSVFEDRAGAEESTRIAADWIRENMALLLPNPPVVLQGEVVIHEEAALGPVSAATDTVGGVTDTVGGVTDKVGGVTGKVGGLTGGLLGGGQGEQGREEPGREEPGRRER